MAIEEQRLRVRRSLEEKLGVEEASYLMDRPVGGWSELVTNHTLDLKFAVLDERFGVFDERFGVFDERFRALDERFRAIDARFDVLEHRLLGEIDRRFGNLAWQLISAVIAGMAVMGAVFAGMLAIAGA